MSVIFQYVIPSLLVVTGIYMSFKTDVIKDTILPTVADGVKRKPYSFSRAQIMWWTLIILPIFCICYQETGGVPQLSTQLLALLGISAGTTAIGSLIDSNDMTEGKERQQDKGSKAGFLVDILDDGNGISVHRFQALIFNVTIGLMFISDFVANPAKMPEISNYQLGLLGISAATYLTIKAKENDKPPEKTLENKTISATNGKDKPILTVPETQGSRT